MTSKLRRDVPPRISNSTYHLDQVNGKAPAERSGLVAGLWTQVRQNTWDYFRNFWTYSEQDCADKMAEMNQESEILERSEQVELFKSESVTLSEYMWNESLSLAKAALETKFVHGIRHGNLNPEQYGAFSVQDVAYCSNAVQDYDICIKKAKNVQVREFLQRNRDVYQEYLESLMNVWHIRDPGTALILGEAAQQYINFQTKVAMCPEPLYFVVSQIPCQKLWHWLANQMLDKEGECNVYSFWIEENKKEEYSGKDLEDFVNQFSSRLNKETALKIYQTAISCEGNFMKSACGEPLEPLCEGLDEALEKL